jgi:hypothetical protein
LQVLIDTDIGRIVAAADAWKSMAGALDEACEDLIRGARDLEDVWSGGAAAEAAHRKTRDTRNEAGNAVQPCRIVSRAIHDHADTIQALQNHARTIAEEARGLGYLVDLTAGTVAAGPVVLQDPVRAQQAGQTIAGYVQQFQDILDRAAQNDQETMTTVGSNLPTVDAGFGTSGSSALSRDAVVAQQGRRPADVKDWWDSLTPEQQEHAIAVWPDLVGGLDGVPASDRDTANRITLDREVTRVHTEMTELQSREAYLNEMAAQHRLGEVFPDQMDPHAAYAAELVRLHAGMDGLQHELQGPAYVQARLNDLDLPPAYLLGFDPADDGRAIVAIGDPDTADNVLTYVPGTMSDLPSIQTDLDRADDYKVDADGYAPTKKNVAIVWMGYDAPDMFNNAGSGSYADAAAPELRSFQEGLRGTHEGPPSHNTVLGHSYGSTVVGFAARGEGLHTDDVIFVGSPGVGRGPADGLVLEDTVADGGRQTTWREGGPDNVYASTASRDVIDVTGVGDMKRFGLDPTNSQYGSTTFHTDNVGWNPVDNHGGYFEQGNPGRRSTALIMVGRGQEVS